MPYDLFISYSQKDNSTGRVTELKERIEAGYLDFAKVELVNNVNQGLKIK
ncbi:MAG: hypothetical protein NTX61_03955 [Bacteroidetes bacterium]|nr:hypothetical protein [Bacteroidota bacterium]